MHPASSAPQRNLCRTPPAVVEPGPLKPSLSEAESYLASLLKDPMLRCSEQFLHTAHCAVEFGCLKSACNALYMLNDTDVHTRRRLGVALRDCIVVRMLSKDKMSKVDFERVLSAHFADTLTTDMRSQLFNAYHHLTFGKYVKTGRCRKPRWGKQAWRWRSLVERMQAGAVI